MPDIQFPDATPYNPNVKFGERPSAFDFIPQTYLSQIRAGTSTVDFTGWIQDGLYSVGDVGGGILYLPWGVYPVRDIDVPAGVELIGDGRRRTFLKRKDTLPPGRGVLNFGGNGSAVRKLGIDGMVTVPVGYTYAELTDPMEYKLTVDTSIWIHGGASDISIDQTLIYHTGGYAILLDATSGNIVKVLVSSAHFENNRPNTAGLPGDMTAGGWGGGIHCQGDGYQYAVDDLHVDKCRFRRCAGNQIWPHLYAFDKLHTDFKHTGCHFSDIGRDAILLGGISGYVVDDCHFRRGGYVCTDDTSPIGTPKWVSNQWAVACDTAGLARGGSISNCTFLNCLGACMDADGLAESTISGNTCRVSKPDEPEYAEDNVAAWPGNYCYGFQSSNSNGIDWAARGVNVTGNYFYNMGLGAVRLYAARKCNVRGNTIWHPDGAAALAVPILLGNIGAGANQRAYDNSVSENDVYWSPSSESPVVFEDANTFAFAGTDKNWIAGNRLFGTGTYEFRKNADTASITGRVYSSNVSGLTTRSENYWQRENGYLRLYRNGDVFLQVLDEFQVVQSVGPPIVYAMAGPQLRVSKNGAGGVITTGARATTAWDDAIATGKLYADCFIALAATTFADPPADLMDASVALFAYHAASQSIKYSVAVTGDGHRIWQTLTGGAVPGGVSGSVQYNNGAGGLAGDGFLKWDAVAQRLTIIGKGETPATSALAVQGGFIQSTGGFLYPPGVGGSDRAFYAPDGGVTALSLISVRNDGGNGLTLARTTATAAQYGFKIDAAGNLVLADDTFGTVQRMYMTPAGLFGFGTSVLIDQAGAITATGAVAALSVSASGGNLNQIHATAGGIRAFRALTSDQALYLKPYLDDPPTTLENPGGGYGGLAYKGGTQYRIFNGSAWVTVDFSTIGTVTPGGITGSVQYNNGTGGFAGNPSFVWNTVAQRLEATASGDVPAIVTLQGYIESKTGFLTLDPSSDAVNVPSGGVTAKSLIGIRNDGDDALTLARTTSIAARFGWRIQSDGSMALYDRTIGVDGNMRWEMWPSGTGVYHRDLVVKQFLSLQGFPSAPSGLLTPLSGHGGLAWKSGTQYMVWNGINNWVTVDFAAIGSITPGGVNGSVQYNNGSGGLAGNSVFVWNTANQRLDVTGASAGVAAINAVTGFIQSDQGFLSNRSGTGAEGTFNAPTGGGTAMSWNSVREDGDIGLTVSRATATVSRWGFAVNSFGTLAIRDVTFGAVTRIGIDATGVMTVYPNLFNALNLIGGINVGLGVTVNQGLYLKKFPTDGTPPAGLNPPGAGFGGLAYKGGTVYRVWNESSWVTIDFATIGGGVTSITGTANQVIADQPTGAVRLSTPQDIATTSYVQFGRVAIGTGAPPTLPLHVFGHAGGEIARFQGSADSANERRYISLWSGNTSRFYEISNEDPNGLGSSNGLAFYENTSGARVRKLYLSPTGAVIVKQSTWGDGSFGALQVHGALGVLDAGTNIQACAAFYGGANNVILFGTVNFPGQTIYRGLYWGYQGRDFGINRFTPSTSATYWDLYITADGKTCIGTNDPAVFGASSGAIFIVNGYTEASSYYSRNANDKTVNIPNGGVWALKVISDYGIWSKSYPSGGLASGPASGYSGLVHQSGTSWWMWNGATSISVDLAAGTGGSGLPGAPSTSVQFNNAGAFGGDANLTWNNTQKGLAIAGGLQADSKLTVAGRAYFGSAGDYTCFLRASENAPGLQTVIDGYTLTDYQAAYPAIYGGDSQNIFWMQSFGGRVTIGTVDRGAGLGAIFAVNGNIEFWNKSNSVGLRYVGFAGQTVNHAQWENSAGVPLVAIDPNFAVIANAFGAKAMTAAGGASGSATDMAKYFSKEIRFAQGTSPVEEANSGIISHNVISGGSLAIIGYGNSNINRLIRLFDDVVVIRNQHVQGDLSAGGTLSANHLLVTSTAPAIAQVYVGEIAPQVALGNAATYAGRTRGVRMGLATANGDFHGELLSGDAYIWTEGFGVPGGRVVIGRNSSATLWVDINTVAVHGPGDQAVAALSVAGGHIFSSGGFNCVHPSAAFNTIQSNGGAVIRMLTLTTSSNPGNSLGGQAVLFCDGGTLWASVNGGGFVNLLAPTGNLNPVFTTVTSNNWISAAAYLNAGSYVQAQQFFATVSGTTIAFQAGGGAFQINGRGDISGGGTLNIVGGITTQGGVLCAGVNLQGGGFGQTVDIAAPGLTWGGAAINKLVFKGGALIGFG